MREGCRTVGIFQTNFDSFEILSEKLQRKETVLVVVPPNDSSSTLPTLHRALLKKETFALTFLLSEIYGSLSLIQLTKSQIDANCVCAIQTYRIYIERETQTV